MITTCGILLLNPGKDKILVGHVTNFGDGDVWSIPKGQMEEGESFLTTALREFREETGISIIKDSYVTTLSDLGEFLYKNKKKKLHAFGGIATRMPYRRLVCKSFTPGGFPEFDQFEWKPLATAAVYLPSTQYMALVKFLDLL